MRVCQSIVDSTIQRTELPPNKKEVSLYSCKDSESISKAVFHISKHVHDKPAIRLSEDIEEVELKRSRGLKLVREKVSAMLVLESEKNSSRDSYHMISSSKIGEGLGLIPLELAENVSDEDEMEEEEDLETRMRDAKMHQEILRAQYANAVKP